MAEHLQGPFEKVVEWQRCDTVMLLWLPLHNSGAMPQVHELFKRPSCYKHTTSGPTFQTKTTISLHVQYTIWYKPETGHRNYSVNQHSESETSRTQDASLCQQVYCQWKPNRGENVLTHSFLTSAPSGTHSPATNFIPVKIGKCHLGRKLCVPWSGSKSSILLSMNIQHIIPKHDITSCRCNLINLYAAISERDWLVRMQSLGYLSTVQ
jgi:hypothetical protein